MTRSRAAAILPSRNEADTISTVTTTIDVAFDDPDAVLLHADSSESPATALQFRTTATRARRRCLAGLPCGKGIQIRRALDQLDPDTLLLLADTDTRNPTASTYRALLETVRDGAAMAVADYPRYWDEANLTNHAARPLIAAVTGVDVPQPLAGDVALAPAAWTAALEHWRELSPALTRCVDGYGVDAFLLQAAAAHGPVVSVPVREVKQHAASFPHLPAIFTEAVPVLLHQARTTTPHNIALGVPRVADRPVGSDELTARLERLASLRPQPREQDSPTWLEAIASAWSAVAAGTPAEQAATRLWPAYLDRVCDWLTDAAATHAAHRPGLLHSGARAVLTALTTTPTKEAMS